ncbi:uncharacterized protein STEHIDRAFT_63013 [Stereum hirsutum FP-91666 SS1]|uniref:uncharacterized protein n=1 Tax=Stereum hirsutum (strain FP-91666) TaxID=721885 RepID=UPI000444A7BE|nr:uncharacterized protein STEHIDRAFT_63013 [Stereum hirsutum FP-91666 SS1]EIM83277.1 hypothetical protein STEHIDRAFT_63013 [Stereum hirsutum FP-91666 SS1]
MTTGKAPATPAATPPPGGANGRIYVCTVKGCSKCFARREHLKRHVRSIHTNEKPYQCDFPGCDKWFSRHDNLLQHQKVHTGDPDAGRTASEGVESG